MNLAGIAVRAFRLALIPFCCPLALTMTVALSGCNEMSNNPHPGPEKTNTIFKSSANGP
jgi:hypothetical protein